MTRTALGMLALLAVAGGVALYAYKGVYQADQRRAAKKDREEHLLVPPPSLVGEGDAGARNAELQKLTISSSGETTVLERAAGGAWRLVSPVSAPADRLTLDAIVSQLKASRFKATVDEHPDAAALTRYGLDHPAFTVEAVALLDGQPKILELEGGLENTFDGTIFMRRNREQPVYAAEGSVRYTMAKTTFELRDKQVLAVDEAQLRTLAVKSKANDWQLERTDGQWALSRPVKENADATQITGLLGTLSAEKAQSFPADSPELRKAFEKPVLEAALTFTSGATTRLRFTRAGEQLLVLREDSDGAPVIAELKPTALQLDRNPGDFKDKAVLRFKRDQVTKIVLKSPAGTVELARESVDASLETWRVVAPRAGKARSFKVTSLLWVLSGYRASTWGEEKPKDWARYGLDANARSVALFGPAGELARLVLGNEVPGQASLIYLRGSREQVLEADGTRLAELPWNAADLLDEPDAGAPL